MKYNIHFHLLLLIMMFSCQLLSTQSNLVGSNYLRLKINERYIDNITHAIHNDKYSLVLLGIPNRLDHNVIFEMKQIFTSINYPKLHIERSNTSDIAKYVTQHLLSLSDNVIMQIDQRLLQYRWINSLVVLLIISILYYIIYQYNQRQKKIQQQLKRTSEENALSLTKAIDNLKYSQTEIHKKYEELKLQNIDLNQQKKIIYEKSREKEQLNKEKISYFTNVAQEFKTPLTLIKDSTGKLLSQTKSVEEKKNLEIINRSAKYLYSMVNQMIDIQKINTNNITHHATRFNLIELVDQTTSDFSSIMQHRDIHLETKFRIPQTHIIADSEKIYLILFNLLSNAVKQTPSMGHITFHASQFTDRVTGNWLQYFSITNKGSSIENEEMESIFNPSNQISDQQHYTHFGKDCSRIGLHIVKELIALLKGKISVKYSEKNDITFRFYFPIYLSDSIETTSIPESKVPPYIDDKLPTFIAIDQNKPTLLLVEDNYDMRNNIKETFSDIFNIAEANNCESGYDIAKTIMPDFIISSLMMPNIDGASFCNKIRENSDLCHIPFLIITANSSDQAHFKSYENGVDDYITTPFDESILIAKVEAIMRNRKLIQKKFMENNKNLSMPDLGQSDQQFMKKVMVVIENNYHNPNFGVKELILEINMSYSVIYKNFISLKGIPPVQFLLLYRLEIAKKLLTQNRNNNVTVSQIAYQVGFNDPKYFTRCFVKEYNMTPSSIISQEHSGH